MPTVAMPVAMTDNDLYDYLQEQLGSSERLGAWYNKARARLVRMSKSGAGEYLGTEHQPTHRQIMDEVYYKREYRAQDKAAKVKVNQMLKDGSYLDPKVLEHLNAHEYLRLTQRVSKYEQHERPQG